jgi:hypothetical protein
MRSPGRTSSASASYVIGSASALTSAGSLLGHERHVHAGVDLHRRLQRADADARPLQVAEHRDVAPHLLRQLAHQRDALGVLGVRAVGEVDAGHVQARVDEAAQHVARGGRGAERGDDLGARRVASGHGGAALVGPAGGAAAWRGGKVTPPGGPTTGSASAAASVRRRRRPRATAAWRSPAADHASAKASTSVTSAGRRGARRRAEARERADERGHRAGAGGARAE